MGKLFVDRDYGHESHLQRFLETEGLGFSPQEHVLDLFPFKHRNPLQVSEFRTNRLQSVSEGLAVEAK